MSSDEYKKLLDMIVDLSMRLNKLHSDFREFEKQRINPKFEEVKRDIDEIKGFLNI